MILILVFVFVQYFFILYFNVLVFCSVWFCLLLICCLLDDFYGGCLVYGHNHILTADGVGYSPQLIGDYVLVEAYGEPDYFNLQVRYEWCAGHEENEACITGLAFSANGVFLAFYYDQTSDRLATTVDSLVGENGEYSGEFVLYGDYYDVYVSVKRRQPDNGFSVYIVRMFFPWFYTYGVSLLWD